MKTTLEIPDAIFRRAKSVAAERGISLREFVTEALKDKLSANAKTGEMPWVKHMGKLKHLRRDTEHINRLIEDDAERIVDNCTQTRYRSEQTGTWGAGPTGWLIEAGVSFCQPAAWTDQR